MHLLCVSSMYMGWMAQYLSCLAGWTCNMLVPTLSAAPFCLGLLVLPLCKTTKTLDSAAVNHPQ